jgi:hypothetical protein
VAVVGEVGIVLGHLAQVLNIEIVHRRAAVNIGRKNYLFFGSENGGKTAATLYTLVQSARRNCVDVWPYLTDVLRRLPAIAPNDTGTLEALLPDRWLADHPEHRLEQREEESREAQARRRQKRAARRIAVAQ